MSALYYYLKLYFDKILGAKYLIWQCEQVSVESYLLKENSLVQGLSFDSNGKSDTN